MPKLADLPQEAETKAKTEKDLRAEITQLKRDLSAAQRSAPARVETKERIVERPIVLNGELKKIEKLIDRPERIVAPIVTVSKLPFANFGKELSVAANALAGVVKQATAPKPAIAPQPTRHAIIAPKKFEKEARVAEAVLDFYAEKVSQDAPLGKGERLCLIAIAQHTEGVERDTITQITGYKRSSRDAYLQRLRNRGYINDGQVITATPEGIAALGNDYEPLPTGSALLQYWMQRLPAGERSVLSVAVDSYPTPVPREVVDKKTGYKRSSRDAYIRRLQNRRLLEQGSRAIKASDKLFD